MAVGRQKDFRDEKGTCFMNRIIESDMREILQSNIEWGRFDGKTVLISGATGMIPSYMVMALLYLNKTRDNFDCKVIALIRSKEKAEKLFGEFISEPYFQLLQIDICDSVVLECDIDYIIQAASPASPQFFTKYPVDTIRPNVLGTSNLLQLGADKKVSGFLFLSSGDVYGQIQDGSIIHEDSLGVVDQLNLRNSYAESKRMAEMLCKAYAEQYDVPVTIARISHTYGPTVNLDGDRRVFSEFVQNIIRNENIVMKSLGEAVRPFCYLTDATAALFKILLEGKSGEAYNMCNDECSFSIRDLANILVNLFPERGLKVICELRSADDDYKEGLVSKPCMVDNSKLRALGWKPQIDIREGFRRMVLALEEREEQ